MKLTVKSAGVIPTGVQYENYQPEYTLEEEYEGDNPEARMREMELITGKLYAEQYKAIKDYAAKKLQTPAN